VHIEFVHNSSLGEQIDFEISLLQLITRSLWLQTHLGFGVLLADYVCYNRTSFRASYRLTELYCPM